MVKYPGSQSALVYKSVSSTVSIESTFSPVGLKWPSLLVQFIDINIIETTLIKLNFMYFYVRVLVFVTVSHFQTSLIILVTIQVRLNSRTRLVAAFLNIKIKDFLLFIGVSSEK
jgi:hypothetical protein